MSKVSLQSLYITLIITGVLVFGSSQIAFADIIIDLDGIDTDGLGVAADQEVSPGDDLVAWPAPSDKPLPPEGERAGIDWLDRDQPALKTWTDGDSLFSEDPNLCTTSDRDQAFNAPNPNPEDIIDCVILEGPLGPIPDGLLTDCDLETGGSPSGHFNPVPPFCQDSRDGFSLAFFDLPDEKGFKNGFWNNGEDIVLDTNGNLKFDPPVSVGGKQIPIDTSTLVLAGTQFTTSWLIPALVAAIGIGLVIARKI